VLEREEYPAGVPRWVDVDQPDAEAATAFYRGLFGWTFEDRMPAGRPGHYFVAHLDGRDVAAIASRAGDSSAPATWNTYIAVARADDAAARVRDAGGTVELGPVDIGDAGRTAACAGPDGARFRLWEGRARPGAAVVNVPGSWNFSDLQTDDTETAQAFYGAVFG
jgi:predicted enzyme related to lactoylglutathione lyase